MGVGIVSAHNQVREKQREEGNISLSLRKRGTTQGMRRVEVHTETHRHKQRRVGAVIIREIPLVCFFSDLCIVVVWQATVRVAYGRNSW